MAIALAILSVLGSILTFAFAQISRRQTRVTHEQQALAKVEVDELDAGLDRLDKLHPPETGS